MEMPLVIGHVPSESPIGGIVNIDNMGTLRNVSTWRRKDGVPRAGTIVLSGRITGDGTTGPGFCGIAARVTVGGPRGSQVQWYGVPNVIPFSGSYVTVDMQVVQLPMQFQPNPVSGQIEPKWLGGDAGIVLAQGFALVTDEWADQAPSGQLVTLAKTTIAFAPQVRGPLFATAIVLTNTSASPVQVVFFDNDAGATIQFASTGGVIVPAQSTIGVGPDVLGPYFQGLCARAVVNLTTGVPGFGGPDVAGGSATLISVSGLPFQIGN